MQDKDFVQIEFTGTIKDSGEIFDLTNEDDAKKAGIFKEDHKYGPVLVIIGAKMTIPGVEEKLMNMKPGEEQEFDVEPAKAFGTRSPKLLKIFSKGKFIEKQINPVPGMFIDIDGMQARVKSASGGRVMMDFNHPLAGRTLHYRVRVIKQITDTSEKVKLLLEYYKLEAKPTLSEGVLTLTTEKELDKRIHHVIENTVEEWVKEVKEIKFAVEKQKS